MIAACDTTFLTLLLNPNATPRPDPSTGAPAPYCVLRIEALIDKLSEQKTKLIVPSPALAETLVSTDRPESYMKKIASFSCIEPADFDARAAFELAKLTRDAMQSGDKRSGINAEWQRVKFDRQIVAIAMVSGASVFYSDDTDQCAFAEMSGLKVLHTWDLELPSSYAQDDLFESGKA